MPGLISATKAAQKIIQGIHKKKLDIKVPLWFVWLTQVIALLPTPWRLALLKTQLTKTP